MIVFVVPLKSPKVSKSWLQVCKLYERSIRSICSQSLQSFRVVTVCNEKPKINFSHPNLEYLEVDFPIPSKENQERNLDKRKKVVTGFVYSKKYNPSHVMAVDADDCISNRIAEFVAKNSSSDGWFLDDGYEYFDGRNRIVLRKKFYNVCASSIIINYKHYAFPDFVSPDNLDQYYIRFQNAQQIMNERHSPIEPLPFIGAVYINSSTGENLSVQESLFEKLRDNPKKLTRPLSKRFRQIFYSKPLTQDLIDEFSLKIP